MLRIERPSSTSPQVQCKAGTNRGTLERLCPISRNESESERACTTDSADGRRVEPRGDSNGQKGRIEEGGTTREKGLTGFGTSGELMTGAGGILSG